MFGIAVTTNCLSHTTSIFAQATKNISIVPGASSSSSPKFYDPSPISITRGTQVIWTNNDSVSHTVISAINSTGDRFNSGLIVPHETFKYIFRVTGNIVYYCSIYPWMTGKVVVN